MNKLSAAMRHIGAKNVLCARLMEVGLKQPQLKDLIREFKIPESGEFEAGCFIV